MWTWKNNTQKLSCARIDLNRKPDPSNVPDEMKDNIKDSESKSNDTLDINEAVFNTGVPRDRNKLEKYILDAEHRMGEHVIVVGSRLDNNITNFPIKVNEEHTDSQHIKSVSDTNLDDPQRPFEASVRNIWNKPNENVRLILKPENQSCQYSNKFLDTNFANPQWEFDANVRNIRNKLNENIPNIGKPENKS